MGEGAHRLRRALGAGEVVLLGVPRLKLNGTAAGLVCAEEEMLLLLDIELSSPFLTSSLTEGPLRSTATGAGEAVALVTLEVTAVTGLPCSACMIISWTDFLRCCVNLRSVESLGADGDDVAEVGPVVVVIFATVARILELGDETATTAAGAAAAAEWSNFFIDSATLAMWVAEPPRELVVWVVLRAGSVVEKWLARFAWAG